LRIELRLLKDAVVIFFPPLKIYYVAAFDTAVRQTAAILSP
jgi:hypothetical protein